MLKKLGVNSEQSKTLNQLLELTDLNSKNQLVVANLLMNEEKAAAMTLLFNTAIPNQSPITTLLRELEKLIEADNAAALNTLKNQVDDNQQTIRARTILLSLLVIAFISQLINVLKS